MPLTVTTSRPAIQYKQSDGSKRIPNTHHRFLLSGSIYGDGDPFAGAELALASDLVDLQESLEDTFARKFLALQTAVRKEVDEKIARSAASEENCSSWKLASVKDDIGFLSQHLEEFTDQKIESLREYIATEGSSLEHGMAQKIAAFQPSLENEILSVKAMLEALEASIDGRMMQAERDAELLWELHRKREHLNDKTFLTSNYKRWYSRRHAQPVPKVWTAAEAFLTAFYEAYRYGDAASRAGDFVQVLRAEVNNTRGESPELTRNITDDAAWLAARLWTSTSKCPLLGREYSSLLNQAIRDDIVTLAPHVVRIIATMAGFNVKDRQVMHGLPPVQWPADYVLFRGGRLPAQHRAWYEARVGEVVRINMNWATTKVRLKASEFMNRYSYPDTEPKVMYRVILDEVLLCDHVNCVEALTLVGGEQEFLFPPYSAFKIRSVEAKAGYTQIEMDVQPNNRDVPEDVDLAPWA